MILTPPNRTPMNEQEMDKLQSVHNFFQTYHQGDPVDSTDYLIWKLMSEIDALRAYIDRAIMAPVPTLEIFLPDDMTYSTLWLAGLLIELHDATHRWGNITYDRNANVVKVRI